MDLVSSVLQQLSYLAGPDDICVSTGQIRRFSLRTGDHFW